MTELTSSAKFVMEAVTKKGHAQSVEILGPNKLRLHHGEGIADDVLVTSFTMLTDRIAEDQLAEHPGVAAIVNTGRDRHYSGAALATARRAGAVTLTFGQLLSALGADESIAHYVDGRMRFLLDAVGRHTSVQSVTQVCERVILARRKQGLDDLLIIATSIYTLGRAQLDEELRQHPDVDLIVNLNDYNQYTAEAEKHAQALGKRLVSGRELYAALRL